MRHLQTKANPGRNSKGIAKRRKRNLRKLISPRIFNTIHNGKINLKTFGGLVICRFTSNDKQAHAWGEKPSKAYRNMLRNFHLKYAS